MIYRRFAPALALIAASIAAAQSYKPQAIEQANLGVSLAQKQDYRAAIEAYKKALAIDSGLPHLYLNLGLAYFKQGSFQQAIEALKHEPAGDQTTTLIGMSQFGLGQYKQAAQTLRPLSNAQPDNLQLSYLLAKCYLWAGEREQSMEMFRALLAKDPDSAQVHMLLGEALDADGREKEATDEFRAAVKSDPKAPEAHFGLGYLLFKQRQNAEAESEFKAELENQPDHALSLAYLGDLMLHGGRAEQALEMLKKAESIDPQLHLVHQDLGVYYQDAKQPGLALKEFQEAVRTAPDNYDAHYRLARLYRQLGRTADADREFAIVQKLHQKNDEAPLMRLSGPK